MAQALPAGIPQLEDTPHSCESIVAALRTSAVTPSTEVAFGTLYAASIEPDILAVLNRALREDLDTPDQRLLFRGIHILGGRQMTSAFRPFIAFLRGPGERVETLGDAITETLPKILAGLFDGDDEPLRALITDTKVDPFVRAAGLRAMGTLCFDGRIGRETLAAYLQRLDDERLLDDEFLWDTWMAVVGVLGMTDLAPQVRAAFADERIPPHLSGEKDFDKLLREALERPDDRERIGKEGMGTIEDVLAELEQWPEWDDEATDDDLLDWAAEDFALHPVHNPFRDVGRNDPCPCGSGKKFKKCCLPQTET
jgi:uncharacterized protein DUF1186/SEC-C motif-containing protein